MPKQVASEQCKTVPREVCQDVVKQECITVPKESCTSVPMQVEEKICQNIPREQCQQVRESSIWWRELQGISLVDGFLSWLEMMEKRNKDSNKSLCGQEKCLNFYNSYQQVPLCR